MFDVFQISFEWLVADHHFAGLDRAIDPVCVCPRDARYTSIRTYCGIKSDGIIYRGLAKYRPQHST